MKGGMPFRKAQKALADARGIIVLSPFSHERRSQDPRETVKYVLELAAMLAMPIVRKTNNKEVCH